MSEVLHSGCYNCASTDEPVLTSLARTVEVEEKKRNKTTGLIDIVKIQKTVSIALCSGCAAMPQGHVFK